jgi:hypothetical protein
MNIFAVDVVTTLGNSFSQAHSSIIDVGKVVVSLFLFVGILVFFLKRL